MHFEGWHGRPARVVFHAHTAKLAVPHLSVRLSMFNVQCSMFNVQCVNGVLADSHSRGFVDVTSSPPKGTRAVFWRKFANYCQMGGSMRIRGAIWLRFPASVLTCLRITGGGGCGRHGHPLAASNTSGCPNRMVLAWRDDEEQAFSCHGGNLSLASGRRADPCHFSP